MNIFQGSRSHEELAHQWDRLAALRSEQIWGGLDSSYLQTLAPLALELAAIQPLDSVLDVGCGVGYLTGKVRQEARDVVGIDISSQCLAEAKAHVPEGSFVHASLEDFAASRIGIEQFSVVLASMVLMDTPLLDSFLRAAYAVMSPGGRFIATIAHPYFWPRYWGYEADPRFDYLTECVVESDFRIKGQTALGGTTTHFHRPLSRYVEALSDAGFAILRMLEVRGPDGRESYPRFVGFEATRERE